MTRRIAIDSVSRQRALTVLSLMRSERMSMRHAARVAGTTPRTVFRHVGSVLRRSSSGRYVASGADRFTRPLRVLTTSGIEDVTVRGSRVASLVSEH